MTLMVAGALMSVVSTLEAVTTTTSSRLTVSSAGSSCAAAAAAGGFSWAMAGTAAKTPVPNRARRDRFIRPPSEDFKPWTLSKRGVRPRRRASYITRNVRFPAPSGGAQGGQQLLVDAAEAAVREDGDHVA